REASNEEQGAADGKQKQDPPAAACAPERCQHVLVQRWLRWYARRRRNRFRGDCAHAVASSSGFGLLTGAKKGTRGMVPSSASASYARTPSGFTCTADAGSVSEPNTIACVGQLCWHAVFTSSVASARPSASALIPARRMRCTQNV